MRPSHRLATVLSISALLTTPLHTAHAAPAAPTPDRLVLNPTATPTTSQTVTWRTTADSGVVEHVAASGGQVLTTATTGSADAPMAGGSGQHLTATLTDLVPDTTYRYRVGDGTTWSDWHTFTTADDDQADPWTFLYFGDAQTSLTEKWPVATRRAWSTYPDAELAIHAGDLINEAHDDTQWSDWFAAHADEVASRQVLSTPGNHELTMDLALSQYRAHFDYPDNGPALHDDTAWFTDYQGVRFISMNGNAPFGSPAQTAWLDEVLSNNPMPWTVVTFHQPMFSASDDRDNIATRNAWLPLLEEHGVDLVLQGHDHAYARGHLAANQRTDGSVTGPTYVVSSAGGKFYDLSPADDNNWIANGAVRAAGFNQTGTFQAITVDGDTLTYRSVIAHRGDQSTAPGAPGDTLDAFTITRTDQGKVMRHGLKSRIKKVTKRVGYGDQVSLPTTVTSPSGPVTAGTVELRRNGKALASAPAGTRIKVPAKLLPVGTQRFTLRYKGSANHRPSTSRARVTVTRAEPTLGARVKRTARNRGTVIVTLDGLRHRPAGSIEVRAAKGKRLGVETISGRTKLRVDVRRLPARRTRLTVIHRGDPNAVRTATRVLLPRR